MAVTLHEPQHLDESLIASLFGGAAPTPTLVPAASTAAPAPAAEAAPATESVPETQGRLMSTEQVADAAFTSAAPAADKTDAAPAPVKVPEPLPQVETPAEDVSDEDYTRQVFKATALDLIKDGFFEDVQDFDGLEFDQETFKDFTRFQVERQIEGRWQQVKQSDNVVEGILSVIEAGGNPDSIIDLFKEHQAIKQIDTTTTEGKLQMIDKFNQEVVKLTKQQSTAKLKRLETGSAEDIQAEFDIANERYTEYFTEQQQAITKVETQRVAAVAAEKNRQVMQTQRVLKEQNVHQKTADKLLGDIYQNRWEMPDGELLSELDYQLLQMRNDPVKNLELARFILDRDNYLKTQTQAAENKVVDKTFEKLTFKPSKSASASTSAPAAPDTKALKDIYKGLV